VISLCQQMFIVPCSGARTTFRLMYILSIRPFPTYYVACNGSYPCGG
jgi:hypothetical protein